ncbi:cytochrome b-245 chaperone 1 homolog [Oscarella lobularis]|uniref:cytochrome b-245 chaperone 1 homolog n=1 Tax=Oscarella lobularis TaxID=121494 RepID=UPI0033142FB1
MAFVRVVEKTPERLHYKRSPSFRSWMVLIGLSLLGTVIASSSTGDVFAWRILCALAGILLGYICFDKWEECLLDRRDGRLTIIEQSMADRFVLGKSKRVVADLNSVVDVSVEKEVVRYAGTGYQVVLHFDSGFSLSLLSCSTLAFNSNEHDSVKKDILSFLDLDACESKKDI